MNKEKFFEYCFGCGPETFTDKAIITPVFSPEKIAENCEIITSFKGRLYSGVVVSKNGANFTVVRCGIGDQAGGDAILLMDITQVAEILFAGTCAGLGDRGIGDLIICEGAFSGEGFARYHTDTFRMKEIFDSGELIPADPEYIEDLKSFSHKKANDGTVPDPGKVFTIGSLMAERRENVLSIEKAGFIGIDMELSAVYQAARRIGLKAAGLAVISDLPLKYPVWEELDPERKNSYTRGMKGLIRLSSDFVLR